MGDNMTVLSSSVVSAVPVHPQKMSSKSKKPKFCYTRNLATPVAREFRRTCEFFDLHKELVPYADAWSWQKNIVKQRKLLIEREEDISDTLIILQHKPVYTLGTGSSDAYLKFDMKNAPFDLFRTERGGEVTYHGPGQLVMYPIINLRYHMMDLHWYLRALEEVIIRAVSSTFSIKASRINGLTGVWVGDTKLAAVGIKVSQWVTYHGLALNVTTDLRPFHQIVPCGIRNRKVGSIKELLWDNVMLPNGCEGENSDFCIAIEEEQQLIDMACESLIREFCEVFQFDLHLKPVPVEISGPEARELHTFRCQNSHIKDK